MSKFVLKHKFPSFVFIFSLILIAASLFLNFEKKREDEMNIQRILAEQQTQKEQQKMEEKNYLLGKFDPAQREDFILIPKEDTTNGSVIYLRKETLAAFLKMEEAAKKDGVSLKIASATRNFDYQKNIWNNKWTGIMLVEGKNLAKTIPNEFQRFQKILEYSALPGTSRHHWGTDIDINAATPEYFEGEEGIEVYNWLNQNASLFGFCQPYTLKGSARPTGYSEEKWHWSYLPLSKTFLREYMNDIKEKDINGFLGDVYVPQQPNLINDYMLGINLNCT